MPALKAGQTSLGHIKNAASMNIQETGRLLLSILLFFDQLLHFLLGLCGTLWDIVAHCGTLWHVHICSLLGFKIRTSNFLAGNLAWSQVGLSSLGSFRFVIRCHPEILEKSGECPTVATLMCITWNSTPCLPQPILRMSQHLLIFFQILGQDFQILQNNSTTSLWLRFKQSPLFNSYEYCKHGVTKKEVAWLQYFESTWSIYDVSSCVRWPQSWWCSTQKHLVNHKDSTNQRPFQELGQISVSHALGLLPAAFSDRESYYSLEKVVSQAT